MGTAHAAAVFATTTLALGAAGFPLHSQQELEESMELNHEVRGSGPAVVLIHGGLMDLRMWDAQIEVLDDAYRVVRFDIRGFGESPRPDGPFSPAEDLARLLDHLGVERAHLVGSSLGGAIAIDFAISHPERVVSLILAEPAIAGWRFSSEVMASMAPVGAALQAGDREGAVAALLETPGFAHARRHDQAALARIETLVRENLEGLVSQQYIRYEHQDALERLSEVRAPVLLLVSEAAGADAGGIADHLESEAPGVTRELIEGSGHMMSIERPEAFNRALLAFLARTASS